MNELIVNNPTAVLASGNIDQYAAMVCKIPFLSAERERELADKMANEKSLEAAHELIYHHLSLAFRTARDYFGYGLPKEDLIQEANVGLMIAVKKFDPSMGFRLATYAIHRIKEHVLDYVISNWKIVKIGTTKAQRTLFFNLRRMRDDANNNIAKLLGVKEEEVVEMRQRLFNPDVSVDVDDDDEEETSSIRIRNSLVAPSRLEPEQAAMNKEEALKIVQLQMALETMSEREQDIIRSRHLTDEPVHLRTLGEKHGVSCERIRQLEANCIRKLRNLCTKPMSLAHSPL